MNVRLAVSLHSCFLLLPLLLLVPPLCLFADGPPCTREDFVVAIDVGHSEGRPGALSARGVPEHSFNRNMAEQLLERLHEQGFTRAFIISRVGATADLPTRAGIAGTRGAGLLISIHHDSVQPAYLSSWNYEGRTNFYSDRYRGYSLFVSEKNGQPTESLRFARLLGEAMRGAGFVPSLHHAEKIPGESRELVDSERGIYRFDDLLILKSAKMPAVLVECGIIVNRDEEVLLGTPVNQIRIALAIVSAVQKYCGEKP
jgi:N-acetylmuramoyl-L-alanine amidase